MSREGSFECLMIHPAEIQGHSDKLPPPLVCSLLSPTALCSLQALRGYEAARIPRVKAILSLQETQPERAAIIVEDCLQPVETTGPTSVVS